MLVVMSVSKLVVEQTAVIGWLLVDMTGHAAKTAIVRLDDDGKARFRQLPWVHCSSLKYHRIMFASCYHLSPLKNCVNRPCWSP